MPEFVPSRDKLEAVNRISAMARGGPEELGPGSKERKRVLVKVAAFLALPVDVSLNKVELGRAIVESLGGTWTADCYSTGYTITLRGLDLILRLAQEERARRGAEPNAQMNLSVLEEASVILAACAPKFTRPLSIQTCVEDMQAREDPNWAQSEWPGFYFESTARAACMAITGGEPGPRYGSVRFDYKLRHVWDFKAHSLRLASGSSNVALILNDAAAVEQCVEENGGLGFVVGHGDAEYDTDGSLREWMVNLRTLSGKPGRRALSGHRRSLKARFTVRRLDAIFIPDLDMLLQGLEEKWLAADFQAGFRQIDGTSTRRGKYRLNALRMPRDAVVATRTLA